MRPNQTRLNSKWKQHYLKKRTCERYDPKPICSSGVLYPKNPFQTPDLMDSLQRALAPSASFSDGLDNDFRRRASLAEIDEGLDFAESVIVVRKRRASFRKFADDPLEADVIRDRALGAGNAVGGGFEKDGIATGDALDNIFNDIVQEGAVFF